MFLAAVLISVWSHGYKVFTYCTGVFAVSIFAENFEILNDLLDAL